ncbi:hypothetical protein HK096_003410 [Nowakowskiella sp. JEL0078]|nr:hypothetical protein HK096_003410 [Nowakowskiella sp. JEL0078]
MPLFAFIRAMVLGKAKPNTLEFVLKLGLAYIVSAFVIPTYLLQGLLQIKNLLHANEEAIYSERFETVKKLFLYSRADELVVWRHVEEHIKKFQEIGLSKIETKSWDDAEHVKLLIADTEGYVSKVSQFISKA